LQEIFGGHYVNIHKRPRKLHFKAYLNQLSLLSRESPWVYSLRKNATLQIEHAFYIRSLKVQTRIVQCVCSSRFSNLSHKIEVNKYLSHKCMRYCNVSRCYKFLFTDTSTDQNCVNLESSPQEKHGKNI